MHIITEFEGRETEVVDLFLAVFSESDGAEEAQSVSTFVSDLMNTKPKDDLYFVAECSGQEISAGIFFSRLSYPNEDRAVFVLSPVAVKTTHQKRGVGQRLIRYGLDMLRNDGVSIALTYGDPAYYSKTGFKQISESLARAPLPLSQPLGWGSDNRLAMPRSSH